MLTFVCHVLVLLFAARVHAGCHNSEQHVGQPGPGMHSCANRCERCRKCVFSIIICFKHEDYDCHCKTCCTLNKCKCHNGTPYPPGKCEHDGAQLCSACHPSFHMAGTTCAANQCTCANGQSVVGPACTEHGMHSCASCDEGYFLSGNEGCVLKECFCPHGEYAIGKMCPSDGIDHCVECFEGYRLVENRCLINECVCENGPDPTDFDCPTHNTAHCVSCDDGYLVEDGKCEAEFMTVLKNNLALTIGCIAGMILALMFCIFQWRKRQGKAVSVLRRTAEDLEYGDEEDAPRERHHSSHSRRSHHSSHTHRSRRSRHKH